MAASVAIHAFVLSLSFDAPARTKDRAQTAPTPPDSPVPLRTYEVVVIAEPDAPPESPETATEEAVAELPEPDPEDPQPTPESEPDDPPPTIDLEPPRAATGTEPAAALRPRLTSPLLWRDIRDGLAVSTFRSVVPLSDAVDRGGPGYTPPDDWAFGTWTARDADGQLWGAATGVIYVGGIAIPTCGGRFDASNCGFGLPFERRAEYQRFLRALTEIEQQRLVGVIMDQALAIRERRDAERDTVPDTLARAPIG